MRKFLATRAGKWTLGAAVLLALAVVLGSLANDTPPAQSTNQTPTTAAAANTSSPLTATHAKVTSVVDGDTVELEGGARVRIVGIDTPETVDPRKPVQCFGVEASKRMRELVEGKTVALETDTQGDTVDKYGRALRYLSLDGADVGAKMIGDGYAYAYTEFPHSRNETYVFLEGLAKNAKRGLWADDACAGDPNTNTARPQSTNDSPKPTNTAPAPTPAPAPSCNCSSDLDCSDFASHDEAQEVHDCCMEQVGYDFHRLDGNDNDGLACESLP